MYAMFIYMQHDTAGASTEGKVDATCVQIGLRGEENYTLKGGRIPPDIWVICKCNL